MKQFEPSKTCVVYIITELELGGAQKICCHLFKHMQCSAYKTKLICESGGILDEAILSQDVTFSPKIYSALPFISFIATHLRFFFTVMITLYTYKKQYPRIIVHTHDSIAGCIGRWAAWLCRIPNRVHTVHGYAMSGTYKVPFRICMYIAEVITSFITTHFIMVSSHDVKISKKYFPFFNEKYRIIRAAIPIKPFYIHRRGTPAEKPTIGTISCFKPQKNLIDLLHAFHMIQRHIPSARLEIIGDGEQRHLITQTIKILNIHHVTLHGFQKQPELLVKQWDIFMLTSLWEGLPCATVEARAAKLPVVAYKSGGIADWIHHGKNGFLSEKHNWKECAYYGITLLQDKDLYKAIANYNDNFTPFTYHMMCYQHYQLYEYLQHHQKITPAIYNTIVAHCPECILKTHINKQRPILAVKQTYPTH